MPARQDRQVSTKAVTTARYECSSSHVGAATAVRGERQSARDCSVGDKAEAFLSGTAAAAARSPRPSMCVAWRRELADARRPVGRNLADDEWAWVLGHIRWLPALGDERGGPVWEVDPYDLPFTGWTLAHVVRVLMIVPLQPISFRFGVFTPHRRSISRQETRPPSPRKRIGWRYSHRQCSGNTHPGCAAGDQSPFVFQIHRRHSFGCWIDQATLMTQSLTEMAYVSQNKPVWQNAIRDGFP